MIERAREREGVCEREIVRESVREGEGEGVRERRRVCERELVCVCERERVSEKEHVLCV